jgi:hypothetical protein
MAIDTLAHTKALEAAVVERRIAEVHAEALAKFALPDLATKAGIERLETVTKADIERLEAATKADIERLETVTKADIERLEMATKADIGRLETATKAEFRGLDAKWTVLMWAVGANVALTVAILGVLLHAAGHG